MSDRVCKWCGAKDGEIGIRPNRGTWESAPSLKAGDYYKRIKCVKAKITMTRLDDGRYPLCQGCRTYIAGKR